MTMIAPRFHELSEAQCAGLIGRNHIGRLGYLSSGRVQIDPISYAVHGGWIVMRSAYGHRVEALSRNPWAAFQVDEIAGPFDWESVVAHGTIYEFAADVASGARAGFAAAVQALRALIPDALTAADPVPERDVIYGLRIDRMTGRMATTGERAGAGPPVRFDDRERPARPTDDF